MNSTRFLVLLAAAAVCVSPALAAQTQRLASGASTLLTLSENPSTGYSWQLDQAASRGIGSRVSIEDRGHQAGAALPGAPGVHQWTVRGVSPGRAKVVFVYRRPWESAIAETRRYVFRVTR